ncbi:MAG: DUF370 domain-containing protein [Clostridia bacterium]
MYLHLGKEVMVPFSCIIGVFDLENTSQSKKTRDFLASQEKQKCVINVSEELPRSFIVCCQDRKTRTYISQISPATLNKRLNSGYSDNKV